ncbi:cysteine desulfurase [Anoxybacter fermentans]|uniref:Cysteine desulfurase n=1 Tax=Anoxybacter fermentans TaxID=1323375 RepID=A0A3S9T1Q3_9FIRM|nr:cysteine desulfurase family protein [Anoxybacter fermentans]AZR74488.1 cysteine desulfurase [Anoxybacter fermentans]
MEEVVYLDNSATTRVAPEVIDAMVKMMEKDYGNPSSLHRMGITVEKKINKAREQIAKILGVKPKEIIFTSGGTEANNLAIRGVVYQYNKRGRHLITTRIEHPSVLNTFQRLEEEGFEVTYLPVDREGFISIEELKSAITPETILVSIMHVNNEIGTIQPIQKMGEVIKEINPRTIFHVDAVQSFGKLSLNPIQMKVDLLTISGHKIHGPKGIGALYCNEKINLKPLVEGGGQEWNIRSGTENVPGIIGLGLASQLIVKEREANVERLKDLKGWFLKELKKLIPDVKINGPESVEDIKEGKSAPYIINLSFPGLKGEVLLHALEDFNIYVSTGSACHSRKSAPSHVLQAIGLNQRELESAIRISLSFHTQKEELEYLLEHLPDLVVELRNLMQR